MGVGVGTCTFDLLPVIDLHPNPNPNPNPSPNPSPNPNPNPDPNSYPNPLHERTRYLFITPDQVIDLHGCMLKGTMKLELPPTLLTDPTKVSK